MEEAAEIAVREVTESFLLISPKGVAGFSVPEEIEPEPIGILRPDSLKRMIEEEEEGEVEVKKEAYEGSY